MKRKPTSRSDVRLTVANVKSDQLDGRDRHLLLALAQRADEHGKNAYPGRESLAIQLGCSPKTIQNRLKRMVELGFLVLARPGHGRAKDGIHKANVYDFALANDAYPETYRGMSAVAKESLSGNSGCLFNPESGNLESGKRQLEVTKAAILPLKAATRVAAHASTTNPTTKHVPSSPTKTESATIVALCVFFEEEANQSASLTKEHKLDLAAKIRAYGPEVVKAAFKFYVKRETFVGTKWPMAKFLATFELYADKGAPELLWNMRINLLSFADEPMDPDFLSTLSDEQRSTVKDVQAISHLRLPAEPTYERLRDTVDATLYWPYVSIRRLHNRWDEANHPEEVITSSDSGEEPR